MHSASAGGATAEGGQEEQGPGQQEQAQGQQQGQGQGPGQRYDLVLMDLQMPVLDGLSATREIRNLPPPLCHVPIFALTADVLTKSSVSLDEMSLDGYLTKPIDWHSLSSAIMHVLDSKEDAQ